MVFEDKLKNLEELSKKIQDPETQLEKSVELFEQSMKIAQELETQLAEIERKIEIVTSKPGENGVITEEYTQK